MGDAYKDVGGRATQDAQAEGEGGGENESRKFYMLYSRLSPSPYPPPARGGGSRF